MCSCWTFNNSDICCFQHTVKHGSYTWIHRRPPPQRRQHSLAMHDVLDMLSQVELTSAEYLSIMRDMDDMDPFGVMDLSDSPLGEPGPCLDPIDSDEEGMDFFEMAALSEALVSGVDDFGPEDFDDEEFNPMETALLSMMMQSNIDEDEEDYSDDEY